MTNTNALRERIIETAKKCGADIVGFAPANRFGAEDHIFRIFPETKTVIGLLFRVLRGSYRTVEEGTTYYQYTTMGVENLEEIVMPMAQIRVCDIIENEGYCTLPQKRFQTIMEAADSTNPEVDYREIYRGNDKEVQMNFEDAAVKCGLGELGFSGRLLTDEFGPFVRYCFILTDAEFEPTPLEKPHICDNCRECENACHGHAIREDGSLDEWRCAVYYNGANGSKNPFMPPEALSDFDDRLEIIAGEAKITTEKAKKILDSLFYYPPVKHSLRSSICGRACDRACYIHLEKEGKLTKRFAHKFREGEDWKLSTEQFENYKPGKNN